MNYLEVFNNLNISECNIKTNECMSKHTTFKIGGPADLFLEISSVESLKTVLNVLKTNKIQFFIIGNGSNLLVDDTGYRGAILNLKGEFEQVLVKDNTITCGSGAKLSRVCCCALSASLTGLEFAYGIPGSLGGAIFMNAGAYGNELKDIVQNVTCMDSNGNIHKFSNEECKFDYRKSIFSENKFIIINSELKLSPGKYEDIKLKMNDLISRRKTKQPLEYPSAGSFFKSPPGYHASALIDQCGLRGFRIGDAAISSKHAGFVINLGKASSSDVKKLQLEVISQVAAKTNIRLTPEVLPL